MRVAGGTSRCGAAYKSVATKLRRAPIARLCAQGCQTANGIEISLVCRPCRVTQAMVTARNAVARRKARALTVLDGAPGDICALLESHEFWRFPACAGSCIGQGFLLLSQV